MKKMLLLLLILINIQVVAQNPVGTSGWFQPGIKSLRPGPSGNESAPNHANYDESSMESLHGVSTMADTRMHRI